MRAILSEQVPEAQAVVAATEQCFAGSVSWVRRLQELLGGPRPSRLAPQERQALLGQISALWDEELELRGRERVKLAYLTRVRRARRLRRAPG